MPHAWVAGDDELGRCSWFRQELRARHEKYLLAVPCNTLVRDLTQPEPPASPSGRRRPHPFVRVDRWCAAVPEGAWQAIEVRPGEKGPIVTQAVRALVEARVDGRPSGVVEQLLVFRERQADGTWKHDYLLAFAPLTTELKEFARVFKAEHGIEEDLKRAKGEAGLGDYQVRTWVGWHHHQALALIATWFLTQETRRGKNPDPRPDGAAGAAVDRRPAEPRPRPPRPAAYPPYHETAFAAQRGGPALPLETTQALTAATF